MTPTSAAAEPIDYEHAAQRSRDMAANQHLFNAMEALEHCNTLARRMMLELDPRLIDEAFARSVGFVASVKEPDGSVWDLIGTKAFIVIRGGVCLVLMVGAERIRNPTIGDFWTAMRLHKVQLKDAS